MPLRLLHVLCCIDSQDHISLEAVEFIIWLEVAKINISFSVLFFLLFLAFIFFVGRTDCS